MRNGNFKIRADPATNGERGRESREWLQIMKMEIIITSPFQSLFKKKVIQNKLIPKICNLFDYIQTIII